MPVAMETVSDEVVATNSVPAVASKKLDRSRSDTRSRSRSRSRSTTRRSKLNISHNLSISDLLSKSFGPEKTDELDVEVQYYFWGAELSCSSPDHAWRIFHPEDECEDDLRHLLFLKQATLGINALEGDRNVVEVTAKDFEGNVVRQLLCSLTLGVADTVDLDLALQYDHEVSFKLIKGSGPVHLVGNHYVETPGKETEDELETEDEDEVEDLDDLIDEDEKDLKEGANEEYETEEDEKTDAKTNETGDKTDKTDDKTETTDGDKNEEAMED